MNFQVASPLNLQSCAKIFETFGIRPFHPKTVLLPRYQPVSLAEEFYSTLSMGGGGNSQQKIEVYGYRCVKMEKIFKTRKVSLFLLLIVGSS